MIDIVDRKPLKYKWPKTHFLQGTLKGNERLAVGFDPGVNFGLTVINMEYVQIIYGRLPDLKKPIEPGVYGTWAYTYMQDYFSGEGFPLFNAVVEGAAYDSIHRQVLLEEIRFGAFLSLFQMGFNVKILPPSTIRKMAFGSGKENGLTIYPDIEHNAVASIGCALAALQLEDKEKELL